MPKVSPAVALALLTVTACACAAGPLTSVSASLSLLAQTASATAAPTPTPTTPAPTPIPTPITGPAATLYQTGASTRAASETPGGSAVTGQTTPSTTAPGAPSGADGSSTYAGSFGYSGGVSVYSGGSSVYAGGSSGGSGSSGLGGSSENGGSAGTATSTPPGTSYGATTPGRLLDLSNWYLTLPIGSPGSPATVVQPALADYASRWFQLDPAGDGIVFTANAGGVTTANSAYPRSELREMSGRSPASWSDTSGTHRMLLRQAVLALPLQKPEVVTAQIHDASSDVMEIKLVGTRLVAAYDNGHSTFTLDPSYTLGTPYDLGIVAANGSIDVYYNGVRSGGFAQQGSGWYFKTGCYVQSNVAHGDESGVVGQVVLYAVQVDHSS